ncbi:MAG: hypothetical protein ACKOX6_00755 [Bdellovibrio sp.]
MASFLDRWFLNADVLAELEQCKAEFEIRRDRTAAHRRHVDELNAIDRRMEDAALQREFNAAIAAIQEKHKND